MKKPLRILWSSNAPWCGTGYGVQADKILPFLKERPEVDDVALFAFYGIQGGITYQKIGKRQILCYPSAINPYGLDIIGDWVNDFRANVVITMLDVFVTDKDFGTGFYWCPYAPIDHEPLPEVFKERFKSCYRPIVYSKFAVNMMKKSGLECWYAPLGVETNLFKPRTAQWNRKAREWLGLKTDTFVVGMVAANKDPGDRKGFNESMAAFSLLLEKHPDCELYIHSMSSGEHGGYDLVQMANTYGIIDKVRFTLRHHAYGGLSREDIAKMYNTFDVLLNPCHRAGFEIPLIEAQASGVPVIVGDWHSMTELCGSGWLAESIQKQYSPLGSFTEIPSVKSIYECLLDAYENKGNESHRRNARDFSMEYDWQFVLSKYWGNIIPQLADELSVKEVSPLPIEDFIQSRQEKLSIENQEVIINGK